LPFLAAALLAFAAALAAASASRRGIESRRILQFSRFPHSYLRAFYQAVCAIYHYPIPVRKTAQNLR
jgi:hypothetical protein